LTTCWITTSVVASGPQHPKLVINAGVPLMTAVNVAGQLVHVKASRFRFGSSAVVAVG
jgi:hypothetical protein